MSAAVASRGALYGALHVGRPLCAAFEAGSTVPNSWVLTKGYSSPGSGSGTAHHPVGGPAVRVHPDLVAFARGVAELLAGESLELLTGRHRHAGVVVVEVAEQIVERAVLEHDHDQMVEAGAVGARREGGLGQRSRWMLLPGDRAGQTPRDPSDARPAAVNPAARRKSRRDVGRFCGSTTAAGSDRRTAGRRR